jgi:putative endonuclease
MEKQSYLYMMGSASRRALYTGVTARLRKRVFMHKNDLIEGFTAKYKCHRLVYFEVFANINTAIAREKQVKGWRGEKKNKLVETMNPGWKDLAANWFPETLLRDGKPVQFKESEHRVPRACSRTLPIRAKSGRKWEPEGARSLDDPRDDDYFDSES